MEGWISLQRKMQSHWLWEEDRCFSKAEAWIDLLLSVNHKPNKIVIKNKVISVKRGQTAMSLVTLAKRWRWDKSKVRRFLELLKSDTMIDTKNETVTTLITICNYESYQSNGNANETDSKRKRNASETHSTPNNNDNNDNNENNTCLTFDEFWDMYDKKVGDKEKLKKKYAKVSEEDREKIKNTLPSYVQSTEKDNKQFRKNVNTYLNNKSWNDEIIANTNNNVEVQPVTKAKSFQEYMENNKKKNPFACQD